jgi:hypothetical protein
MGHSKTGRGHHAKGVIWSHTVAAVVTPEARHMRHRASTVSWCDRSFLQATVLQELIARLRSLEKLVPKLARGSGHQGMGTVKSTR